MSPDTILATPADWANSYKELGLTVVPAYRPGGAPGGQWKRPIESWRKHQQGVDNTTWMQWYGPSGRYADHSNMGVLTGASLFVIDLDTYKGASATAWWQGILNKHNGGLEPQTASQTTGGGGRQLFFLAPADRVPDTFKKTMGVDVRGKGGFAMLPPSQHSSGKAYAWDEGRSPSEVVICQAPEWLLQEIAALQAAADIDTKGSPHLPFGLSVGPPAAADNREKIMRDMVWGYIVNLYRDCPIKPAGPGLGTEAERLEKRYFDECFALYVRKVAPRKHDSTGSVEERLEAEGRGVTLFRLKWRAAMDRWDTGVARDAANPPPVQEKAKVSQDDASDLEGDEAAALIDEFNRRYMVVNEAGKAFVFEEVCDYALKRQRYQRMNFDDFGRLYSNRLVAVGIDKKGAPLLEPAGRYWLGHPKRRQFIGGVIFDPSNGAHSEDMLNLWRGFALEPRAGSWARLKHHMLNNVCNDNEEHYDFLLKWMARMFQFPGEQGEVAIVLCGIEGTGKGTVAKALKRLLGQHGLAISNTRHLTGNFNSHMRDVIFLFADEAFFAGDKAHVGVLKALVTEPTLTIEGKYQNAVEAPNYLHLMLASNEAWVVPASLEARRFFVLNVSDRCANNHDYFAAIHEELDNGGYEAMLHELLNLDLTGFNHRRAPRTVGLQEQQKLSLPVAEKWWIDVLMRGYVWRSRLGLENFFSEWHECVSTELLFDAYVAYAKEARERHPLSREALGKYLVRMGCSPCRLSDAVVGEHLVETSSGFGTSRVPKTLIQPRARGYQIGTLNEARAKFQKATKLTSIDWADEDDAPEDVF